MKIAIAYILCFLSALRFERIIKIVIDGRLAYLGTENLDGKHKTFYFNPELG